MTADTPRPPAGAALDALHGPWWLLGWFRAASGLSVALTGSTAYVAAAAEGAG